MKPSMKLHRTATLSGTVLVLAIITAFAMPVQAAYIADKATTAARATVMHLSQRFCGNHHHHHGHQWCSGHRDYWCSGH